MSYDFLEGYEELVTPDARVQFLKDAKQRARDQRLQDDEIPEDSREFSNFQMQRLLKRNKINAQLDVVGFRLLKPPGDRPEPIVEVTHQA